MCSPRRRRGEPDLGGAGCPDALGREIASWRESGGTYSPLSTPSPASVIVYNLAGQVVQNWDANSARVTRTNRYDEAGRLVYVTTDPATTEGIEYLYGPGGLGRVTEVNEVTYPVRFRGGAAARKQVAVNHYDTPYNGSAEYGYVEGRLAWTENPDTMIAYGYDDARRVWRRDQWFGKLDPAQRFTVSSTYGADGRVLDSRVVNPYSAAAEYQYFVDYDSAGRPVALSGKLASQGLLTRVYEVVQSQGTSGKYGGYDALGRVPVMRADDGRVVSARRYNALSGALEGECKRFGDAVACGSVSASGLGAPPGLDPVKDLYRTDQVAATYRGAKLASYVDSGTATSYTNSYLPNGRLATSRAAPTGTAGSLTQDWLEAFLFNGIGNIARVDAQRNTASGNGRPDRYETEWYTPESPASGQALDRVVAVGSRLSTTSGGTAIKGTAAATPGSTSYAYDLLGHLTRVTRSFGESETLVYAPGGELLYRQVGERFTFYVGEYATVTASGAPGCGAGCLPLASTVEVDAHVVFAGTRIASVKPSRALYYYRTRLGTVIGTSLGGGVVGAGYRYTPYGEVELTVNETEATRSELGYTNALRLTGSLLYLKNRVYDTEARVFVQPDTVDRLRYAYAWSDPANLSDPTGLAPVADPFNTMNPVQRIIAELAQAWSRESWFTEGEIKPQSSEEQTNKESRDKKKQGVALQTEEQKKEEKKKKDAEKDRERRAQLKAFADKVVKGARENPQRYSDVAALAMVANYAAAMTGDPGQFVDDMGAVLAGVTHETLLDEGLPLSPDFGQTGFRPEFQEPQFGPRNNQVRHFIGFVVAGYEWGAPGASVVNAGRELWDTMRGYSSGTWPDVRLGNAGADLGWRIRLGEIAPKEVGDWIQRNIANTTP